MLNPQAYLSKLPVQAATPSVTKRILIASPYVLANTGPYMFRFNMNNIGREIEVYYFLVRWQHLETISLSEDIRINYTLARYVSSAVEIYSDTMPGGLYSISGRFNAV